MGGGFMIFMDPPDHTQLRSLVSRAFTPRRVTRLEVRIRDLCAELFDAQSDRSHFDYVQDFAARLPAEVIAALIGVPEADREYVRKHIDLMFHIEPGVGMINDVSLEAGNVLTRYLHEQLLDRAAHPRDDMLTDLTVAEITDDTGNLRKLTAIESATFANLIISAGTETVARLLGNAAVVLAAQPGTAGRARGRCGADPERRRGAAAVRGAVAGAGPVDDAPRSSSTAKSCPADSKVLLLTGAAGRDERKYPDADRFDIHRAHRSPRRRSGTASTSASAPRWPASRDASGSRRRCGATRPGRSTTTRVVRLHTSTVRGYSQVPITVDAA